MSRDFDKGERCDSVICKDFSKIVRYPLPKRQVFNSSKLKEFADDNFKFDVNCATFFERIENSVGKGEIACVEQFLVFPVFSRDWHCRNVRTKACFGTG